MFAYALMPIYFALSACVLNAGNDLIYSRKSRSKNDNSVLAFYFLSSLGSAILAFFFVMVSSGETSGISFSKQDIFYGITLGLLSFCTYYLFILSFSDSNTSITVTIYRMNMIPGILLAVLFLGEALNIRRGLAILACVVSISLLSSWKIKGFVEGRSLICSVGACLFGSVLNVLNKIAVQQGGVPFKLIFLRFVVVVIITGIIIALKKSWRIDRKSIKFAFLSGAFLMSAIFMTLKAYKTSDVAIVLPITQLSFALVALVSWLFFKEKMNMKKVLGILFAIGTILLIK